MHYDKPVIAIVGRPNVGKSTLFNRISGSKTTAIVDPTPGVTRDRNYIECTWCGKEFLLVDTGGLDPLEKSKNIFIDNISKQVNIAINEAALILFIVDIKEGINPIEKIVAETLRKSGKKIILVINKIDYKDKNNIYEFANLGFKDTIEISASHGINIGDLLDKISNFISTQSPIDELIDDSLIKITIVGKPNVGKSSLLNYILGEERSIVTEIPGTTRDSIHSYFKYKKSNFMLVDTAGIRKLTKIYDNVEYYSVNRTFKSIEKSDIVLLLIDATTDISEQDEKIAGYIEKEGKACIIVVNKWDIADKDTHTTKLFIENIHNRIPFMEYAPIFFISARTGLKVIKLLDIIPQIYSLYINKIPASKLNKVFKSILLEKKPVFSKKGGNNKLIFITQVGVKPPSFILFARGAGELKESYLRFIKNKLRMSFPLAGVPLNIKIKKVSSKAEEYKNEFFNSDR